MQFPGVVIIGTGARAVPFDDTSQMVFVEVVLIDKTHHMNVDDGGSPGVYQVHGQPLRQNTWDSSEEIARQLGEDAFVMMGEILKVDKKQRHLHLGNGTIVAYKHLIVAAGSRHTYVGHENLQEFRTGVRALAEALRFRQVYIEQVLSCGDAKWGAVVQGMRSYFSAKKAPCGKGEGSELEPVVRDLICEQKGKRGIGGAVGGQMHKVFCEVQLAPAST